MVDRLDCEIELTLKHIPFLVEHLSKFAYKWSNIGTALGFQPQNLRNIEACPLLIATAPSSFLQRLVEEWLEGKYTHTALPTLANLLKALNSHTVGLGTLASLIRDSLTQSKVQMESSFKNAAKVIKIASLSECNKIVFYWKNNVTVNENMHVHLKVETCETSFEWSSIGLVPITDKLYSNTDKPVLCISEADIDMDGSQYSCRVAEQSVSTILKVSCPQLDQYKRNLASIYLAQPEVPQDTWPPVSNKTYINLALIKQQAINYGGEYARLTVRGDIDDILHHKEKLEYGNIFDGLRSGSLLLIEGRPGSGKTTFVHKITRDWAASEVQGPMRLVLLVSLRVLNGWGKPVTLEDILKLLKVQMNATVFQEKNGKGLCFIFDGLDEFSPLEGKNSIVYEIINKAFLPQSIVIVASRPAALVKFRQRADKVVEVIGFPKDQIFKYVNNYPFSNTLKADQLKSYLLSHPNVLHMCYLPIHAAMVAFLFEVMGKVPRTETEIYKHFTRFTLIRSLTKQEEKDELEDVDTGKLSGEERELFDTICEFALEKTIQQKQVLDQDEMKLCLQGKCRDISLGLVTVDRTAGLYGFKNIYTFLHLTYQEYLAAHHVSTLSDKDQLKLIKQYGNTNHMQVVWKFYFGLVNFEGHEYKILVSGKNKISLLDIQRAYESQQEIVCSFFMTKMDAQIILEDKYLTTTDFTALGYLLANSSIPASLSLIECDLNAVSANALLAEIGGKPLSLRALYCKSIKMGFSALVSLLRNSSKPVSLSLIECDIHLTNIIFSQKPLLLRTLFYEPLPYESHGLSDSDVVQWILSLQHGMEHLKLSNVNFRNGFSKIGSASLANLKELSLQYGPEAYNYNEELSIDNTISALLAQCVLGFSALEKLTLKGIGSDATLLTKTLSCCVMLKELHLSYRRTVIPITILDILTVLIKCSDLQKLFLTNVFIGPEGALVLSTRFQHWPKLQELHLRGCSIKEEGAKAIADNLKYCPALTIVDLSENNISNETLLLIQSSSNEVSNEVAESNSQSHDQVTTRHCTLF